MGNVYVLAVLGESPAVLSELLWWLTQVEKQALAGIEVWSTGRGDSLLREFIEQPAWEALQACTGRLPTLAPASTEPEATYGFRSHRFASGDKVLNDVRSQEESLVVSATLHDRMQVLHRELGGHIKLVGSLAGGRKTVSAALQTAFSMQARLGDRLVHVLQHETLEMWLREHRRRDYVFPTPAWAECSGVPVDDQLVVYDVAFPRLRYLAPRRLVDAMETRPWEEVWSLLEENSSRDLQGVLTRVGMSKWDFEIIDASTGEQLAPTVKLGTRSGAILAAMAVGVDSTSESLLDWLDENPVGWTPKPKSIERRKSDVRKAVLALREQLVGVPPGLERLIPAVGYEVVDVTAHIELP